jgi:ligand-binding SRPBCC domain-containing protein
MMKFRISTLVDKYYLDVKKGFNADLLSTLSPPFPPVKLLRFDGSEVGDLVTLELNLILFKQIWISKITEAGTTEDEYFFVDEGVKLPFFLGWWKHRHRIVRIDERRSEIRDEITYSGRFRLLTPFLYPILYLQFLFRRPIYRRVFSATNAADNSNRQV